jgi:NADPH-dependent 7-cyano-7-deazaguanine reductase QueF
MISIVILKRMHQALSFAAYRGFYGQVDWGIVKSDYTYNTKMIFRLESILLYLNHFSSVKN